MSLAKKNNAIYETDLQRNLVEIMTEKGASEVSLSQALNIPYNTIRRIISGSTTDPRISTLKLIADYLDTTVDELIGGNISSSQTSNRPNLVPVLTWEDISQEDFLNKTNCSTIQNYQSIPKESSKNLSSEAYALESKKSMQPRFPLGTILIIDPLEKPMDGDLTLVRIRESKAVSLRELFIDPPDWNLLPITANSTPITYNPAQHEIVGIVILTMTDTRKH